MSITVTTEKQFESDIETFSISAEGGYTKENGFKHMGTTFKVCYFKPESALNDTAGIRYADNEVKCYR